MEPTTFVHGLVLYVGDTEVPTGETAYEKVGVLESGSLPEITVDTQQVSTLESPGRFHEFKGGWKDAGESEYSLFFNKDQETEILALVGLNRAYKVAHTSELWSYECGGILSTLGHATDADGFIRQNITIKWSGQPTFDELDEYFS